MVAFGFSSGLIFDMVLMVILGALGEAMYLVVQRSIPLELDEADSGAIYGLFLAILTGASILGSIGLGLLMDAGGCSGRARDARGGDARHRRAPCSCWSYTRRPSRSRPRPTTDDTSRPRRKHAITCPRFLP